jgi:hypothetical protein
LPKLFAVSKQSPAFFALISIFSRLNWSGLGFICSNPINLNLKSLIFSFFCVFVFKKTPFLFYFFQSEAFYFIDIVKIVK